MSTLFIADPGLRSVSGHHPAAATTVARLQGFSRIIFFGHEQPDTGLADWLAAQGVQFQPHFKKYLYEAYRKPWSLAQAQPYVRELAQDYSALLNQTNGSGPIHVLHHTLDWPHLAALSLALAQTGYRYSEAVQHVFLMFDPGISHDGQIVDQRQALGYKLSLASLGRYESVKLYTSSIELLEVYADHFGLAGRIRLHPVFHFSSQNARSSSKTFLLPGGSQLLLYVGDAKEAKGFTQLPALVHGLLQHSSHKLIVQVGLDDRLRSARVASALALLQAQAQQSDRLQIIDRYLPEDALQNLLLQSDCLLMNYSPAQYAHQTSGLLWQAAAAKLPVVVVGDSWVSREARRVCEQAKVFSNLRAAAAWLCATPEQQTTVANAAEPGYESYRSALFRPLGHIFADEGLTPGYASLLLPVNAVARYCISEQAHAVADADNGVAIGSNQAVLFIDACLPDPAASAGGYAAVQEMALFRVLGYRVRFLAVGSSGADAFFRLGLEAAGIEVRIARDSLADALSASLADCNLVFVTRFNVVEQVLRGVRSRSPSVRVWLNLADFHGLRLTREAQLAGGATALQEAQRVLTRELAMMRQVDLVLSYSEDEIRFIQQSAGFAGPVAQLPWVANLPGGPEQSWTPSSFEERAGVAFLGGFLHSPNVDAVAWFVNQVMPLLRAELPGVVFDVYGSHLPPALHAMASSDVRMHGYVDHPEQVYQSCRVFVAPLRFGAGIKGKVAAAMAHGVPAVCSSIAAEGIGGKESGLLVCDTPQDWARQITALYNDAGRWRALSAVALNTARNRYSFASGRIKMQTLLDKWA